MRQCRQSCVVKGKGAEEGVTEDKEEAGADGEVRGRIKQMMTFIRPSEL
jgi:hypothetical protein